VKLDQPDVALVALQQACERGNMGMASHGLPERNANRPEILKSIDTHEILGVRIAALTGEEALELIHEHIRRRAPLKLAFCNAHTANLAWSDAGFRACLDQFTVLADGIGVDLGARILYGAKFPANLNGTDFVPHLLEATPGPLSVMLLGGRPEVAQKAALTLSQRLPRHDVSVLHHGFFNQSDEINILARIEAASPDILLVALGNPLQEQWIARHCTGSNCRVAIGVGALFDFLAGEVVRAPAFVRRVRLEWLWRLAQEPTRLFRRYVLGNPLFLARIGRVWLARKFSGGVPAR
jgi:exopolysaccharide biosynthesis WecB/TagA/CpsF family protein